MGSCCSKAPVNTYDLLSAREPAQTLQVQRVMVIVNPRSGGRRAPRLLAEVQRLLAERNVQCEEVFTEYGGHASEIARTHTLDGFDAICCLGGDGTLHEVVNGLMKRTDGRLLPVAPIPAGSGNTVAFGFNMRSHLDGVRALLGGRVFYIDLVEVSAINGAPDDAAAPPPATDAEAAEAKAGDALDTGAVMVDAAGAAVDTDAAAGDGSAPLAPRTPLDAVGDRRLDAFTYYSVNMIGWALPAQVLRLANQLRCCGRAQYNLAAYKQLLANPVYRADIRFPEAANAGLRGLDSDVTRAGRYIMVQCQLTVHMGDKMPFCPRAKADDGLLDLVLVPPMGRCNLVKTMEHAKRGAHIARQPRLRYVQAREVLLMPRPEHSGPGTLNIDGELQGTTPCRLRVVPRVLPIFVP